jgi:ABC-type nitrate/sulfonate/bicarbonate transport system permease component
MTSASDTGRRSGVASTGAGNAVASGAHDIVLIPGRRELDPARAGRVDKRLATGLAILVPVLLIVSWQVAATARWIDVRFFPGPTQIVADWRGLVASGDYATHLGASAQRIAVGYVLGAISGVLVGLLIGRARLIRKALEPTIIALYTVPKLAILPLLLLILGIGEAPKLTLIAVTVFFIVLINTNGALEAVPAAHVEAGQSFGLNRIEMVRHIILPAASPQIFVGLRIAAGMAVLALVGAEFVAAESDLGYLIWNSWNLGIPSYMYIGIVTISVLGVLANGLLRLAQRLCLPWDR